MESTYAVQMPNIVLYGPGSFGKLGEQARRLGTKALIISDPVMDKIGNIGECEKILQAVSLPCAKYVGVDQEPTDKHVNEALSVCRSESCNVIVAIGGGSCIDTAKAVAVLMTNEGTIQDYAGNQKPMSSKPVPLIAVPTTAGTGSEVTRVTVITSTSNHVKMMISQPELMPTVAIVDPVLTLSCPPSVTAATGIDALCHALEAFISRRSQPLTDLFALQAIELIMKHLMTCYQHGDNIDARANVAYASMLAGAAFSNASVTLVHGMSRPIGALFHVPHGLSNAMLLPAVLKFTRDSAVSRLAKIAESVFPETAGLDEFQLADLTISRITQLCKNLCIPNMHDWGIEEAKFKELSSKMAKDALDSGSPGNNPRIPTHEEIIQLYLQAYHMN